LEAKRKAEQDRGGQLKALLVPKLAPYSGRGLSVVSLGERASVVLPAGLVRAQGTELSEPGRTTLCNIVKAMSAVGPLTFRIGAFAAHADPSGTASTLGTRELAAARAASASRVLEDRCAVPGARILSAGFVQPGAEGAAGTTPTADQLQLDVAPLEAHP